MHKINKTFKSLISLFINKKKTDAVKQQLKNKLARQSQQLFAIPLSLRLMKISRF